MTSNWYSRRKSLLIGICMPRKHSIYVNIWAYQHCLCPKSRHGCYRGKGCTSFVRKAKFLIGDWITTSVALNSTMMISCMFYCLGNIIHEISSMSNFYELLPSHHNIFLWVCFWLMTKGHDSQLHLWLLKLHVCALVVKILEGCKLAYAPLSKAFDISHQENFCPSRVNPRIHLYVMGQSQKLY